MKSPPPDATTQWALGASLPLVGACLSGIAMGWLAGTRSVGGLYVTFLMPLLMGSLIGWAAAFPARRLHFGHARPLIAAAALGAIVCFLGQQVFAYLQFMELLATKNAEEILVNNLGDPIAAALIHIENMTGEEGYFAYLAFTSKLPFAQASPIGLVGRLEIGVTGTIVVGLAEFGILVTTAVVSVLWRTRTLRRPARPMARCDDAQLLALARALEADDVDAAAGILTEARPAPTHAIFWLPADAGIAVWSLDSHGRPAIERSQRQLRPGITAAIRLTMDNLTNGDSDAVS